MSKKSNFMYNRKSLKVKQDKDIKQTQKVTKSSTVRIKRILRQKTHNI